jgi:hypothetical protein
VFKLLLESFLEKVNRLHVEAVVRVRGEGDVAVAANMGHLVRVERLSLLRRRNLEAVTHFFFFVTDAKNKLGHLSLAIFFWLIKQ